MLKWVLSGAIDTTFIEIIPKSATPNSFNDDKPISLCNLIYKVIAKVIAKRIRSKLFECLSKEQFDFLHNRLIFDAIGVAHESLHTIKVNKMAALILKLE